MSFSEDKTTPPGHVLVRFRGSKKPYCYFNSSLDLDVGDDVIVHANGEFIAVKVVQTDDIPNDAKELASRWIHQKINEYPQEK